MPLPKSIPSNRCKNMSGGASSDFASSFYSGAYTHPSLNTVTLNGLANTPVFNPMSPTAVFATQTSGVIPNGMFYGFSPMSGGGCHARLSSKTAKMNGGGCHAKLSSKTANMSGGGNKWIEFVRSEATARNISYRDAMRDSSVRDKYHKLKESGRL